MTLGGWVAVASSGEQPSTSSSTASAAAPRLSSSSRCPPLRDARLEAKKSRFDALKGVRCLACGKHFKTYTALEAHLTAKHGGWNSADAKLVSSRSQTTGVPGIGKGSSTKKQQSLTLSQFIKIPKPTKAKAKGKEKKLLARGKRPQAVHGGGGGGEEVDTINPASSKELAVRRSKEREGGRKQKITRVKLNVLTERFNASCITSKDGSDAGAIEGRDTNECVDEDEYVGVGRNDSEKQEENLDGKKEEEEEGEEGEEEGESSAGKERFFCSLCKVRCPNHSAYVQHCSGKLHKATFLRSVEGGGREEEGGKVKQRKPQVHCWVGKLDRNVQDLLALGERDVSITSELNAAVKAVVEKALFFQRRAYQQNPRKCKKRVLFGLNEVKKSVKLNKCKALIVVPNIELNVAELVDTTRSILEMCEEKEIAVVFALTRAKLGSLVKKGVRMSMCSIVDKSGCEDLFKEMLALKKRDQEVLANGEGRLNASAPAFLPSSVLLPQQ